MPNAPMNSQAKVGSFKRILPRLRENSPTGIEWLAAGGTSVLMVLSFPNFKLWFLAWVSLVPLLWVIGRSPKPFKALLLGWGAGTVFFYATCYWLTYSMIHYGGLPTLFAYMLVIPAALVAGLFPGLFALVIAFTIKRLGLASLLLAPFVWPATEWLRLTVTGQLWNALGYSQATAFLGLSIHPARWGGVYAVSFVIVIINSAIVFAVLSRRIRAYVIATGLLILGGVITVGSFVVWDSSISGAPFYLHIVAVQPNVPMTFVKSTEETEQLFERHLTMSSEALKTLPVDGVARLVVWPESPMNFTYGGDSKLRERLANFTRQNQTSLLLNSLERAPGEGAYNSALLINEEGRLVSQYDKIRLMPFGEYVPVPRWIPGASLITGIVGEFTPGTQYTLMPIANRKVGVFICIEAAYPWIARELTRNGADLLINISNDGYLGPTAVMEQHLGNAVFRAVENGRPLARVTNTGLTAEIRPDGYLQQQTTSYHPEVRTWGISDSLRVDTFYTRNGDLFVLGCVVLTILIIPISYLRKRKAL